MTTQEFILKLSQEGRAWLALLLSSKTGIMLTSLIFGWHCPQPKWMKWMKKPEAK